MRPMRRNKVFAVSLAMLGASIVPATSLNVRTSAPVACSADASFQVVRFSPLLIDATVHQVCNTLHELTVTYQPEHLSNPVSLHITLEGSSPDSRGPGSA